MMNTESTFQTRNAGLPAANLGNGGTRMKMYVPTRNSGMMFAALLMTVTATTAAAQDTINVSSPDGRNDVGVAVNDGKLYYTLTRDGRRLLMPSMLGFEFRA